YGGLVLARALEICTLGGGDSIRFPAHDARLLLACRWISFYQRSRRSSGDVSVGNACRSVVHRIHAANSADDGYELRPWRPRPPDFTVGKILSVVPGYYDS